MERLLEITEDSFNEGLLGPALVSVLVVLGIVGVITL
jgi:hypothetical protein